MKGNLRTKTWLVTMPIAGLAAAYVWFLFLPGQKAIADLNAELQAKQATITGMPRSIAARQALEKELQEIESYQQAWEGCSSNSAEVANLFGQIAEAMKTAGIETTRFAPEAVVKYDRMQKIPLRIGFSGSFPQICDFLMRLEKINQRIWVEDFNLEKEGEKGDGLKCELNLAIFAGNSEKSD
jgi:Tfp pilus assembly protein PilO